MNYLKLTFEKLEVGEINDLVAHESCGAISLFVGTTRDNFDGKTVVLLQYEAYEAMALKTMNNLCDEIRTRWPDVKNIGIHHRLGTVPVKEASVVIAVSSPHRKSSLEAVHYAIDELKKKRSCLEEGTVRRRRGMLRMEGEQGVHLVEKSQR